MKADMITVIYLKASERNPKVIRVKRNDYRAFQALVGGTFAIIGAGQYQHAGILSHYDIGVHDEGLLLGQPVNIVLEPAYLLSDIDRAGILVGDIFVTAPPDEEGNAQTIPDWDVQPIIQALKQRKIIGYDANSK